MDKELNQSPQGEVKQMGFFFLNAERRKKLCGHVGGSMIAGDCLPPNQDKRMKIKIGVLKK